MSSLRTHLKDRKYFHICFPQTGFPCLGKCDDILLGCGVWGQGSVSLDKPENHFSIKLCLSIRNLPALLTSQGSVWGRSRISLPGAIMCEGLSGRPPYCPRAQLLTLIHHLAPLWPRPSQQARSIFLSKEGHRRQITTMNFMMCFMVSKPFKALNFLWSLH